MVEEISRNFDRRSKFSDWSDFCQEVLPSLITWYRCGLVFQQFHHRIRLYYPSLDLYHHPCKGSILLCILGLLEPPWIRQIAPSILCLYQSASYMSFVIPAWLKGLRDFGEICRKPKHCLYEKTLLTLMKLIYPPTIPINIKIIPNYREKPTL